MVARLLQRIGQGSGTAVSTEESVCAYLQELFNTSQGGEGTSPDFGLSTAMQVTRPEALPRPALEPMIGQIKACVAKYEPRLRQFEFAGHEDDGKNCRFKAYLVRQFHDDGKPKDVIPVTILVELGMLGRIKVAVMG